MCFGINRAYCSDKCNIERRIRIKNSRIKKNLLYYRTTIRKPYDNHNYNRFSLQKYYAYKGPTLVLSLLTSTNGLRAKSYPSNSVVVTAMNRVSRTKYEGLFRRASNPCHSY